VMRRQKGVPTQCNKETRIHASIYLYIHNLMRQISGIYNVCFGPLLRTIL
jgi:hypothetical protein